MKTWIWINIVERFFKDYLDEHTNDYIWENRDEVEEMLR